MNDKTEPKIKITERAEDFSRWYTDVIAAADMADYSPVKGCMIIKPHGYAIWENIQKILDGMIKETGVQNAYFPLFIPESFLKREASHVEGFSPELAVVTHAGGKKLEEPLVVRPTSETIIYDSFARWIQSWRDLPLQINQWCNVVRWEMRTRLFLRTTEFLWQEGHTAHATHEEAEKKVMEMLDVYKKFANEYLAIPVIAGVKSESEKFAGAVRTTCVEALMQDGKALQCGTSHDLGQNFAKAFDVKFSDQEGKEQFVWQTSWGVSTRLIGALILTHGDDQGMILPPRVAPIQAVVVPIWKNDEEKKEVVKEAEKIAKSLKEENIKVHLDSRDLRPAWRYYEWERKGVPLRIEIGPRDIAAKEVVLVRRDTNEKSKAVISGLGKNVISTLESIQKNLFERARKFRDENTRSVETYAEFKKIIEEKGGFISTSWCGSSECEAKIKEETKATIRCIPFDTAEEEGKCIYCGGKSKKRVLFAQAY